VTTGRRPEFRVEAEADGAADAGVAAGGDPAGRRRWPGWITPWRLTAAAVVALLFALVFNLVGPEPPLVVSERTTLITAPLAADGYPDYSAHVLASYGPAPPPEENAAVPLLEALWPMEFTPGDLALVCRAIGIPATEPARPALVPAESDPLLKGLDELVGDAQAVPWRGDDAPELGGWLDRNDHAIDLVVVAASRPRYWLPSPSLLRGPPESLVAMLLPDVQSFRKAARALACRGMRHAGEGRFDEAWRDVLAIHRLARLLVPADGRQVFLITSLVGSAVASMADHATLVILGLPELPDATLAAIRRDLAALPPVAGLPGALAAERLMGADAIVWMRRSAAGRRSLAAMFGAGGTSPLEAVGMGTSLDWNVVAETMNEAHARLDAAARQPTFAARQTAANGVVPSGSPLPSDPLGLAATGAQLLVSRQERSRFVGKQFVRLLLPAISSADAALQRSGSLFDLVGLAAALEAAKRADPAREYPARLEDLVPEFVPAVPADRFTDRPLAYSRRGDGYLLYSLGQNMADDGGTDIGRWIVGGEWQEKEQPVSHPATDIVVRMPMPKRPLRRQP
jgi:hypothetical protein